MQLQLRLDGAVVAHDRAILGADPLAEGLWKQRFCSASDEVRFMRFAAALHQGLVHGHITPFGVFQKIHRVGHQIEQLLAAERVAQRLEELGR